MTYQIRYTGTTGNSFGTSKMDDVIEIQWNDLDVAKANLKRIEAHYRQYEEMDTWNTTRTNAQIIESNANEDWIVLETKIGAFKDGEFEQVIDKKQISLYEGRGYEIKQVYDESYAQNCIKLYTDNGKVFQLWCPWCGYFETLHSVEIEGVDNDLKIEF